MTRTQRIVPTLAVSIVFVMSSVPVFAQAITGTIEGRVEDAQGGALPGVSVTAIHLATSARFTTATTPDGFYRLSYLPLGAYDVRAELTGFRAQVTQGVIVRLNETSATNFVLTIAPLSEAVLVRAETPVVQTTTSDLRRSYDETALREIPLSGSSDMGRNVYEVALQAPGVTTPGGRFGRARLGSGGGNVIANGTTARSTNYELDGISNVDPEDNDYRVPVSIEGVREFEVVTANYNAEFGRAGGAQVRAVSKSGANAFHGSAFEYFYDNESFQTPANPLQNSKCTVEQRSGFAGAPPGGCYAAFTTHLYGGTIGGPIRRDRIFFFAMFENAIRRGENAATGTVPLATERTVNTGSAAGDAIIRSWLELYPLPNRPEINIRRFQTNVPFAYDTPNPLGRVDFNISDRTKLMARYDVRNQDYQITRVFKSNGGDILDHAHTGGASLTRVFSPNTVGEFRFGYAYRQVDTPTERGFEDFPTITVTGFGTLGPTSNQFPILRKLYDYQGVGSIAHTRGRHSLKGGYDLHRTFNNGVQSDHVRGTIGFATGYGRSPIENLLAGTPTSYNVTVGDPDRNFRYWDLGLFVQDDYRIRDNLTLNLGFRNEAVTAWRERDGLTDFGYDADWFNPAPRAGFAYDVTGTGTWVVRGAYGLSYDRISFFRLRSLQFQQPFIQTFSILPGAQPLHVTQLSPTAGQVTGGRVAKNEVDPEFELGPVHTWNVTLERDVARLVTLRASYVGSATRGLPVTLLVNRAVATPDATLANRDARRPDAVFSNINRLANASDGNYRGLQLSAERRFSKGWQFQFSYTWSRALDIASDAGFGSGDNFFAMDSLADAAFVEDRDRGMELRKADMYGPTRFDMRHVWSLNGSYATPKLEGLLGALVSDWSFAATARYRDGVPFTVFCSPNSGDCNLDGVAHDRVGVLDMSIIGKQFRKKPRTVEDTRDVQLPIGAFDQSTCGQPNAGPACTPVGGVSNQPRNRFRFDDFFSTDLSIVRNIRTFGAQRLQVRLDGYNITNNTVAGGPNLSFTIPGDFGRVFSAGGNRSLQIAVKYLW